MLVVENDLNSDLVKAAASYIPEGEADRGAIIALLDIGIAGCKALQAIADSDGVKGRLKRLMDDITHLQTGGKHSFSDIIQWCQIAINHLLKNK